MRVLTVLVAPLALLAACADGSDSGRPSAAVPTSTAEGSPTVDSSPANSSPANSSPANSLPDDGASGGPIHVPTLNVPTGDVGIPGIYVPLNVAVVQSGASGAQLTSTMSCPELIDVVAAGQWDTVSRMETTPDQTLLATFAYGFTASAIFAWGDDRLFVRGAGPSLVVDDPVGEVPDPDYCMLRIDRIEAGEVVITGAVPFAEVAVVYPVKCVAVDELTEVNMAYSLGGDQWLQLKFQLRTIAAGTHQVDGASFEAGIAELSKPPWELIAETLAGSFDDLVPTLLVEPSADVVGTATVEAGSFSGTVTFDALVADPSGEPVVLTAPWSCGGMGLP